MCQSEFFAGLISHLSAESQQVLRSAILSGEAVTAQNILENESIDNWDRLLLLLHPEVLGGDKLLDIVNAVVGLDSCCKDCVNKDTQETRRTFRGALWAIKCHLRHHDNERQIILTGIIQRIMVLI